MHLIRRLSVSLALVAAGLVPHVASAQSAPSVYWGAYVNGAPFDTSKIDKFEADAGKRESIVHWGEPWEMNGRMMSFQTPQFETVRRRGSIPMITWSSMNLSAGIADPNYALAKIYNGNYDWYITSWAQAAKAWGHPFFMRFDYEMNGWWFPWNEKINGNHPGDFVRAWRHVVGIFRSVGATNVTWVWTVNVTSNQETPLAELYPGDSWVDWTGVDGYNWGLDHGMAWFWFDQVFGLNPWTKHRAYDELVALAPSKPIMIAETATSKAGGDPAVWIKDALLTQLPQKYKQVKALVWLNWNAGEPQLSWPIESSWAQQSAFRESIASSYYATNTFGSLPWGPIKPLSGHSSPPPTSTPSSGGSITLKDIGDTYVDGAAPNSAAGGPSATLISDGSPYRVAFVRFDLSSLAGKTITSATLHLHTTNDAGAQSGANFDVMYVANNTWNGATMTMNHSVPISSTRLGALVSPNKPGTWYQIGLTAAGVQVGAGGLFSVAVKPSTAAADGLIFNSKEGDPAVTPQLVVAYR